MKRALSLALLVLFCLGLHEPRTLRVCADPAALPYSNEKEEGFENRIAHLISVGGTLAEKLLDDGGQLGMHQRRGVNRRRVVVKDRVERLYR